MKCKERSPLKIYLVGSLRNRKIVQIGNSLRADGHNVFDDWQAPGPDADDHWKTYESERGRGYREAIKGEAANHTFSFDMGHIDSSDVGVLVLPAGKSAHLELGYMLGRGKRGYVLFEEEPEKDRWDLMYKLATGIFFDVDELREELKR